MGSRNMIDSGIMYCDSCEKLIRASRGSCVFCYGELSPVPTTIWRSAWQKARWFTSLVVIGLVIEAITSNRGFEFLFGPDQMWLSIPIIVVGIWLFLAFDIWLYRQLAAR
jgi:hypothetical protein